MASFGSWLKHTWNAFMNQDGTQRRQDVFNDYGTPYGNRPDRSRYRYSNEKSIVSSVLTRIAMDAAGIDIQHVRTDSDGRFTDVIMSGLNNCLTVEANIDQAATMFKQDIIQTMFEYGVVAVVPVDTTIDPTVSGAYDINTMRVGRIITWYPRHVRVEVYNDDPKIGYKQEIVLPKNVVAIAENPLYSIMNEPNSTLQRLIRKLNLLDVVDEASSSGKLDLIIQLPYVIKSESRRLQAEQRRKDIEFQLKGSQYGIAYTDGTERITQLNRPAENNLMGQVEYLTAMLYSQLGITDTIMNGTADEKTMLNYYNRVVEPVLTAIVEAMIRTFLTKTARTQGQSIMFFRNALKLVPIGGDGGIADIADKFSRNEILTSNEIRSAIGYKPSKDPNADKLQNSNMPQKTPAPSGQDTSKPIEEGDSQNGS